MKEPGCATCPFKDLRGRTAQEMKDLLQRNYDENRMDCRAQFPRWKPGDCHKGGRPCVGY